MLFSMQLCTLLFGNKPIVKITLPTSDQTVTTTSLGVTGTIDDLDGDQTKVKVWIEDHTSIYAWDTGVTTGNFEVSLDLSNLSAGIYYVIAQGYDANDNVSDAVSVRFNYQPGGGGGSYTNILLNADFSSYIDNYSGTYDNIFSVNLYLNNTDGDWLENWYIFIDPDYGFDNLITISMDGNSIRYSSTANDNNGVNRKLYISQAITNNHIVTPKTKFHIKFKINSATVGTTNPEQGELKIFYNYVNDSGYYIASFSSLHGVEGSKTIYLFVNCAYFDVTIYEIAIYEEP